MLRWCFGGSLRGFAARFSPSPGHVGIVETTVSPKVSPFLFNVHSDPQRRSTTQRLYDFTMVLQRAQRSRQVERVFLVSGLCIIAIWRKKLPSNHPEPTQRSMGICESWVRRPPKNSLRARTPRSARVLFEWAIVTFMPRNYTFLWPWAAGAFGVAFKSSSKRRLVLVRHFAPFSRDPRRAVIDDRWFDRCVYRSWDD